MKRIYSIVSSNIGIIVLFLGYFLLFGSFFNSPHVDQAIAATIGDFIGRLIPPLLLMLIFRNSYKWSERKQVTNWLLFAYIFQIVSKIPGMQTPVGVVSILIFIVWFIATIARSFSKKKAPATQ